MGKAWLRQYGLVIAVGILVAVVSIVIFVVRQNGTSTAPTATHVTVTQNEPAQVVEDTKETDEFLAMWVPLCRCALLEIVSIPLDIFRGRGI